MKHINGLSELSDITDPMFQCRMNPDLTYPRPYTWHRFPIERFQPLLHQSKLKPSNSSGIPWKCLHVTPRGPEPKGRLIRHNTIFKF